MVLLVDGDRDERDMYEEYLAQSGMRVMCASDGATGLETARELLPDVVVMDLRMPVMDGLSALEALQADPRTSGISVVLLSGEGTPAAAAAARAGCRAFLLKPCLPRELEGIISSLVELDRLRVSYGR